jgi:hypothetical protein
MEDHELFLGDDGFSKRYGFSSEDENISGLFAGFDDDPIDDGDLPCSEEGLEDISPGESSSY